MRIVNEVRVQVSQECSHFLRRVETFARSGEGDCQTSGTDRTRGVAGSGGRCQARHAGASCTSWVKRGELQSHGFYGFHGLLLKHRQRRAPGPNSLGHAWQHHPTWRAPKLFVRGAFGDRSAVRHPGQSVKSLLTSVQLQFSLRGGDVEQGTQRGARNANASPHDATAGHCG